MNLNESTKIAIIGAGASGIFTAIQIKELDPSISVCIYEEGSRPLKKVKISGGGRCNVTHHQFDTQVLSEKYPRGHKELRGPFTQFQPLDMVAWLKKHGVDTKFESDGRIFPVTNSSESIIECFLHEIKKHRILIHYHHPVENISYSKSDHEFKIEFNGKNPQTCSHLVLSTGSSKTGHRLAKALGHKITELAPSLFTFKVTDFRLQDLAGISFQDVGLQLEIQKRKFTERGPLLITHWGLSGPALIRLSAWAARELQDNQYQANLKINFFPDYKEDALFNYLLEYKKENAKKKLSKLTFTKTMSKRYWLQLLEHLQISSNKLWSELSKKEIHKLIADCNQASFRVQGKGIFKEEFVTCGGISRKEIDFKTMMSKKQKKLFATGELLDIDGITGGFNFQNAWTSAYLVAHAIQSK